ncbi:hypothetical protein BC939DRAFT_272586 [Gamsiella multidivaricata]|uniref:uncharacterized protein n=1 Tax=Gamsiella multidivaricata TaxID=101098 RepID=UPI00221FAF3E|nr:uncharacterized protein BC939DRAFT_272586 [Gamsiella multidivaricata]KAI7819005.1 hypothetical protein BC939DRAFT_272586 [Gamsiella multidivaricata]
MKFIALVSLAAAVLALSEAAPNPNGHSVPLTRNPHFKHNTHAQIAKLNRRYPGMNILKGSTGNVPLTNVHPDLEYYGSVSVGSPAQVVKLDFDTVRLVRYLVPLQYLHYRCLQEAYPVQLLQVLDLQEGWPSMEDFLR